MKRNFLFRNIILAFVFFFIGRIIVLQMGTLGYWIIAVLVIGFYVFWYFWGRTKDN